MVIVGPPGPEPEPKTRPILVAVVSDLHINSTLGLCPPQVQRLEGNLTYPNRIQEALAQCWGDFWQTATGLQLTHNADLWIVINGDLVEGHHHQTTQLISTNDAIQFKMALAICRPLAQLATRIYIVCGTAPTHAGPAAGHEEQVAFVIGAQPDPSTGRHTWWHLKFQAGGVKFDVKHHRRQSHLPWTHGGPPNRLAASIVYQYAKARTEPPDVAIRSHGHRFDESSRQHPVKVVFTPCWQMSTAYGARFEGLPDIGGLLFLCQHGRYQLEPLLYPPDPDEPWTQPEPSQWSDHWD